MINLENYYKILCQGYNGFDNKYKFVIDNIKNSIPFAYARFNDGEMMGIEKVGAVAARGDQPVDESLHKALIEAIEYKQDNYYVGVPCPVCYPVYNKLAESLVGEYEFKTSAVALTNRNWSKFMKELPDVIENKKVRFFSGDDQKTDFLEKTLKFNLVEHVKFINKSTWEEYYNIYSYINNVEDGDIVFISLGPTARVLVRKWFEEKPNATFIDIGSVLDPFTRDVWHNCHKGWENGFNKTGRCSNCN